MTTAAIPAANADPASITTPTTAEPATTAAPASTASTVAPPPTGRWCEPTGGVTVTADESELPAELSGAVAKLQEELSRR